MDGFIKHAVHLSILLLMRNYGSLADEKFCGKDSKDCHSESSVNPKLFEIHEESLEGLSVNNHPPLNDKRYVIKDGESPIVLWWYDDTYPYHGMQTEIQCNAGSCTVSKDREDFKSSLTRGFVLYGTSFTAGDLPLPRLPHHEWGLFHEESPKNNWMFSHELGISLFNHTATFRRESDYPLSTQYIPHTDDWLSEKFYVSTKEKNRLQREQGLGLAVYVQRDCNPPSDRDTYVQQLMKFLKIDSFGPCLNNNKIPEEIDGFHKLSSEQYYHFLARYKFQIAFENSLCQDYMTEKLFRPLVLGSVPIYLGSDKAQDFMPAKKAMVMVNDFESPQELADYIIQLNENDDLYEDFLRHRFNQKLDNPILEERLEYQPWSIPNKEQKVNFRYFMFHGFSCYICDRIHERNNHLKAHLNDPSQLPLPLKMGDFHHMGCPKPKPIFLDDNSYWEVTSHSDGLEEAKALVKMLRANETNSENWRKYLKTDNYP